MGNSEITPTVVLKVGEVVFLLEIHWYVLVFDTDVLRSFHWCLEVTVRSVKASKFGARAGQDIVDHELDEGQVCSRHDDIVVNSDVAASDYDARAIGVILLRADFTNHADIRHVFATIRRNIK